MSADAGTNRAQNIARLLKMLFARGANQPVQLKLPRPRPLDDLPNARDVFIPRSLRWRITSGGYATSPDNVLSDVLSCLSPTPGPPILPRPRTKSVIKETTPKKPSSIPRLFLASVKSWTVKDRDARRVFKGQFPPATVLFSRLSGWY